MIFERRYSILNRTVAAVGKPHFTEMVVRLKRALVYGLLVFFWPFCVGAVAAINSDNGCKSTAVLILWIAAGIFGVLGFISALLFGESLRWNSFWHQALASALASCSALWLLYEYESGRHNLLAIGASLLVVPCVTWAVVRTTTKH